MTVCVPIKYLKDTTAFAETVAEARRDLWSALEYLELVDKTKKAARNLAAVYKSFKQNAERLPEMYPLSTEARLASLGYRKAQAYAKLV